MAVEEEHEGAPSALSNLLRPAFAGMQRFLTRKRSPRRDPTRGRVQFQPVARVVRWDGEPEHHRTEECRPGTCGNPGGTGHHSEVRPEGFVWEGTHFHTLTEALENQAFRIWYEAGGQAVVEAGKLVVREDLYGADEKQPLPTYNFRIEEHIHEMSPAEVAAYRAHGEVPKRFRRRGRNKPKPSTLELSGDQEE